MEIYYVFSVKGSPNPSIKIITVVLFHGYECESNIFSSLPLNLNAQLKSDKCRNLCGDGNNSGLQ